MNRSVTSLLVEAVTGGATGAGGRLRSSPAGGAYAGEDLEAVDDIDVFVDLPDGSRWSATILTLAQVEILMKRWATSGEALGGRYFWCPDGLIVRDAGISNMTRVLTGLIENGEFARILHRLDE
ncbi:MULTISPECIES: hypothetical protein [Streptomyces]|uniref:Uncharacterized protein n=1 Tax=Streptomyces eurythermus TaxID=42237 RepID=A0ABW6YZF5_9ACTN|nr:MULTISPECIES: hypothetical protein [Streptomyces]QIS69816.1 hypothetical protein HB370_07295 [Streptomyces sp. DSM 40868]